MITNGIDLVSITRMRQSLATKGFAERVFTAQERAYFQQKHDPAQTAAAHFAAKEAFSKALGSGLRGFSLQEVSVTHTLLGQPQFALTGNAAKWCQKRNMTLSLSLSHDGDYAIASVVAQGENPYQTVVFDLDGTLLDSSIGVFDCFRQAIVAVGYPRVDDKTIRRFIGPPTPYSFEHFVGMTPEDNARAVTIFEDLYHKSGKFNARVYDGIPELLRFLKDKGCTVCVATLKTEAPAREVLEHFGLAPYVDFISGNNEENTRTKADALRRCLAFADCTPDKTVLIGDGLFDLEGAKEVGVDFIAATYGFGPEEGFPESECVALCDTPTQMALYV